MTTLEQKLAAAGCDIQELAKLGQKQYAYRRAGTMHVVCVNIDGSPENQTFGLQYVSKLRAEEEYAWSDFRAKFPAGEGHAAKNSTGDIYALSITDTPYFTKPTYFHDGRRDSFARDEALMERILREYRTDTNTFTIAEMKEYTSLLGGYHPNQGKKADYLCYFREAVTNHINHVNGGHAAHDGTTISFTPTKRDNAASIIMEHLIEQGDVTVSNSRDIHRAAYVFYSPTK